MNPIESTRDYVSIGQLAAHLRCSMRDIERAATELQMVPALRLNFVPHFDAEQVERLKERLALFKRPSPGTG